MKTYSKSVLYTKTTPQEAEKATVLIVDTFGMLASLYRFGTYAYVGGGFTGSPHNLLEAAVYGVPVFCTKSKKATRFFEEIELSRTGILFKVASSLEMEEKIKELDKKEIKKRSKIFFEERLSDVEFVGKKIIHLYERKENSRGFS